MGIQTQDHSKASQRALLRTQIRDLAKQAFDAATEAASYCEDISKWGGLPPCIVGERMDIQAAMQKLDEALELLDRVLSVSDYVLADLRRMRTVSIEEHKQILEDYESAA